LKNATQILKEVQIITALDPARLKKQTKYPKGRKQKNVNVANQSSQAVNTVDLATTKRLNPKIILYMKQLIAIYISRQRIH